MARHHRTLLALSLLLVGAAPLPGVGPDAARHGVDINAPPWSALARLQIPGVSRCTAVLVAPRTALTAAHCLWERRLGHWTPAASIHLLSRYAAGGFAAHALAAKYRIGPGFDPLAASPNRAADIAVVTLAAPLGGTPLALAAAPPAPGTPAMLGGYNQDRAEVIDADTACHITGRGPGLLLHDCAGTRGTSGGPLLTRDASGTWRLAGLQVAAFGGRSGGVAVAASVLQDMLEHNGLAP